MTLLLTNTRLLVFRVRRQRLTHAAMRSAAMEVMAVVGMFEPPPRFEHSTAMLFGGLRRLRWVSRAIVRRWDPHRDLVSCIDSLLVQKHPTSIPAGFAASQTAVIVPPPAAMVSSTLAPPSPALATAI